MASLEWDDDNSLDLDLGLQNIFEEISLDFLNEIDTAGANYYEPKSKKAIEQTPWVY